MKVLLFQASVKRSTLVSQHTLIQTSLEVARSPKLRSWARLEAYGHRQPDILYGSSYSTIHEHKSQRDLRFHMPSYPQRNRKRSSAPSLARFRWRLCRRQVSASLDTNFSRYRPTNVVSTARSRYAVLLSYHLSRNLVLLSSFQADGVVVVKTKQAILVAEYTPPIQAPEATPVVESLADYLISVGY